MKILVVVDMQNDFIDGALGTKEAQAILPNVIEKVKKYRDNGDIIIFTADTHHNDYMDTMEGKHLPVPHCILDTNGWSVHDSLVTSDDLIIMKSTFGRLNLKKDIDDILFYHNIKDVESIEIVGLCTDICVISNALILKAGYLDTPIICDASCCAGVTPEKHNAALEVMTSCQIEVTNWSK